jgi:hypothetical protein
MSFAVVIITVIDIVVATVVAIVVVVDTIILSLFSTDSEVDTPEN